MAALHRVLAARTLVAVGAFGAGVGLLGWVAITALQWASVKGMEK